MTNNSLSEDIYAVGQLMADNLNTVGVSDADADDGLTTLAGKILNANPTKVSTVLTIDTPMVVYTDRFNVTGVLTDNEDNPIEGATIQLIWDDGTEHIATGATNSSGVFSFTSTDPASVSQYSFQLFFAGDANYNSSSSSVVNVNTAKETSVLVVTSPASGAVVSTDSVAVSGTAKDNDNTPLTGKNVYFLLNGSSAGSTTVGSDGSFTKTVTGLSAGSNSIRCDIAATTTHTAANQSITVNRSTFDGLADIELIDGSQILSYADEQQDPYSQYATLETQLMNCDSPAAISGVTVQFWDFTDESSPLYLGEGDTDSNGKASYTYYSTGAGDVPIKAVVGSLLTKTFAIRDVHFYDTMTSDSGHWTYDSGVTKNYSSDGVSITSSSDKFPVCDVALPNNFKLTFKAKSNLNNNLRYCAIGGWYIANGTYSSTNRLMLYNSWPPQYYVNNTYSQPNVVEFEAEYNNGTLTLKKDGATIITQAITLANQVLQLYAGGNTTVTIKDIIIEEL